LSNSKQDAVGERAAPITGSAEGKSNSFVLKHPDFKKTEATRPDFDPVKPITIVKSPDPDWRYGQGVNDNGASLEKKHIEIDPYAEGRPMMSNYKLLISGIVQVGGRDDGKPLADELLPSRRP
jgi:hypothetical protein